jgi:uncharacterized protein
MDGGLKRQISEIRAGTRRDFSGVPGSHDWGHVERVEELCLHIARVEGGDRTVLELAAILHDIGRLKKYGGGGGGCHAEIGAHAARGIMSERGMDPAFVDAVSHCILTHRYRGTKIPLSLEAKILFDADKLDSMGATGIGRAFMFASEIGARFHNSPGTDIIKTHAYTREDTAYREYIFKLRYIKKRMLTAEGRRLAEGRHAFMKEYFDRLLKEVKGRA